MKKENIEYCEGIVETLQEIIAGNARTEDGEGMTILDYINNALDCEFTMSSRKDLVGVKLWVTLGGPNVWIDTRERVVKLAWGSERAEAYLPGEICDAINEYFEEVAA